MKEILIPCLVLGGLGLILGFILSFLNKKLYVEPDTRAEDIQKMLPGVNCGSCGFPGCSGFANAIVNNEVQSLKSCKPGKVDANFNPILEYVKAYNDSHEEKINVKL